ASVTLNNGVFHNTVSASRNPSARFAGRFALTLNGGDFSRVSDVTGTRGLPGGSTSSLSAPDALLDRPNSGELAFANPLLPGADPWVFFHEGFYYATSTGGSQLSLRKAANLPDLPNASPRVIYKPAPGHPWSRNLWSPKIYHFSETEVGPENAGWWLYLSANDGSGRPSQGQRMFALRSLSNSPFGPYGEAAGKRVPHAATRVSALKNNGFNDRWCGGPKIIRHAGTLYAVFVSEVGDASSPRTGDRYQTINIDRLVNPWTLAGEAVVINRPTFPWEKHGAGPGKAGMYPEVVEGGVPVPSPDGSLCLLYAGSGYWTPHYAIGVMRLMDGGDPMNPAHWQKTARPIFKASADVLGPGNACCVPSPTGKSTWVIYHAYVGKKTRGVPRQLFAEPCVVANGTVTIGNGHPLPLGTPLKIEINPLPLRPKISAFSSPAN
ncbi:MAG: hypothetical protein LBR12_03140, partial [Opitutaceae bacterium]|nr:hypothetical protein [Opitutaceae bacterium]